MIRLLLALFPRHFRETFGDDMRDVFRDQLAAARRRGRWTAVPIFWLLTTLRMVAAAWAEHRADAAAASHTRRGSTMFEALRTDLRLTARSLARAPMFAAITIGVISIGIGAVATIFSAMNALVLRPLPGTTDGDRLFTIDRRSDDLSEGASASGRFSQHLRAATHTLDDLAVWSRVALSVGIEGQHVAVPGSIVSPNYFDVLGLRPAAGRFFRSDHEGDSVVISHRLWVRYFDQGADVIGRSVRLNGRAYDVIGVAPAGFRGVFTPIRLDAWVPLHVQSHVRPGRDLEHAPWLWMFGRLREGITPHQAAAELTGVTTAWTTSDAADTLTRYTRIRLTPLTGLPDDARQAILGFGGVLLGAAGLVLLVACANVSSLLAMRANARRHEMGLRTALGASRFRLVRQLLTETLLLFLAGAAGGVVVAVIGTSALEHIALPGDAALMLELSPDARVVLVAAVVALVAGLAFGIGPGLRGTSHGTSTLLRGATAGSGTRRGFVTTTLIVGQLAGSLVLLTTTALFVRALGHGAGIDPGFSSAHVHLAAFNTESYGYDPERSDVFYAALREQVGRIPGVADLAFGQAGPLLAQTSGGGVTVVQSGSSQRVAVQHTLVGPGYFSTLGIRVRAGRGFDDRDRMDTPTVAVVNTIFARLAWPDRTDVVGLTFMRGDHPVTVIGVADDVKFTSLDEPPTPFMYLALSQHPQPIQTLFVRSVPGAPPLAPAVTSVVQGLDPSVPVPAVLELAHEASQATLPQRVAAMVTSILGGGALLLACVGLYGVMASAAAARTREVGVRMALGATRGDVLRLFVTDGLRLTVISLILGLAGAAGAAQLVSAYLLGGNAFDVVAFTTAAMVLSVVAVIATLAPARRAAAVDPSVSLRDLPQA
jgi:predicted permease